jgi:hypothetical protein
MSLRSKGSPSWLRTALEFGLLVACAFCFLLYADGAWDHTLAFLKMWL